MLLSQPNFRFCISCLFLFDFWQRGVGGGEQVGEAFIMQAFHNSHTPECMVFEN